MLGEASAGGRCLIGNQSNVIKMLTIYQLRQMNDQATVLKGITLVTLTKWSLQQGNGNPLKRKERGGHDNPHVTISCDTDFSNAEFSFWCN